MQSVFDGVSATAAWPATVMASGRTHSVVAEAVSGDYFGVMGLQPAAGRLLQETDDKPAGPAVAIISSRLWRRLFDGSDSAIGQAMPVNDQPFTIVGVAPPTYRGALPNSPLQPTDVWITLGALQTVAGFEQYVPRFDRSRRRLRVTALLSHSRTANDAAVDVRHVARLLDDAVPLRGRTQADRQRDWTVIPVRSAGLIENPVVFRRVATAITSVVAVLLMVCVNVATVAAGRVDSRRFEVALRRALGAAPWRVARGHLVETGLIVAAGGLGSLVVARALTRLLAQDVVVSPTVVVSIDPRLDSAVLPFIGGAVGLVFVVCAVVSIWSSASAGALDTAAGRLHEGASPRWRGSQVSIAIQVVVSVVLITLAASAARQSTILSRQDMGIDLDRTAIAVTRAGPHDDPARRFTVLGEVERQLLAEPTIEAVAVASGLPIRGAATAYVGIPGEADSFRAELVSATRSVFETLGLSAVRGRTFDERDNESSDPVVVLGQDTAIRLFGTHGPLGQRIQLQRQPSAGTVTTPRLLTVIGVVDDRGVEAEPRFPVYVPIAQHHERDLWIIARTSGNPARTLHLIETVITRTDPGLSIAAVGTGVALARPELGTQRLVAGLTAGLGTFTFGLALAGTYGLLSHVVLRRKREIAIRMALGANTAQVVGHVLRQGLMPVFLGTLGGILAGVVSRIEPRPVFMRSVPEIDPWALVLVPGAIALTALAACYVPAVRAAGVDPKTSLQEL
jgi:predicted permease